MSKAAAVHTAILLQMASEGKTPPTMDTILGPVTVPGVGGAAATITAGPYAEGTIRGFLANVAFRLRSDAPPLAFNWSAVDPKMALAEKLWVVEVAIADATTSLPPPVAKEKDNPES
jgi:hypothetical protein